MIRSYITNIPKNTTVSSAGETPLIAELLEFLKKKNLLNHYDSIEGIDQLQLSECGTYEEMFRIDLKNGIFEATTLSQHNAMIEHLNMLDELGRLKPKAQSAGLTSVQNVSIATAKNALYGDGEPKTLLQVLPKYAKFKDRSEPSKDEYSRINSLNSALGERFLHEYTAEIFEAYLDEEIETSSARTIDEKLGLVKRIFSVLIDKGSYKGKNPLQKWTPMVSSSNRKTKAEGDIASIHVVANTFGSNEFAEFGKLNKSFYLIIITTIITTMRISSICRLKAGDLVISTDNVPIIAVGRDKTKSGKREIPIPRVLFDTLKNYLAEHDGFGIKDRGDKGFSDGVKDFSDDFFTTYPKFKSEKLNPHGLRSAFNNFMLESQIDEPIRAKLMGHKIRSVNIGAYSTGITPRILVNGLKGIQEQVFEKLNFDPAIVLGNSNNCAIKSQPFVMSM
jgi:integrase